MDDTRPRSAASHDLCSADALSTVRRRWWVVVLSAGIGLGAGAQYAALQPKVYESATSVLVRSTSATADHRKNGLNLDTEAQQVTSTAVTSKAAALLHAGTSPETIAARVSVQIPSNTSVLVITFDAPDARSAQAGAHAFAQAYLADRHDSAQADLTAQVAILTAKLNQLNAAVSQVNAALTTLGPGTFARASFESQRTTLVGQIQLLTTRVNDLSTTSVDAGKIIQDTGVPAAPSRPNRLLDCGAGTVIGLVLGAAGSLVRGRLRRRIDRPGDLAGRVHVEVIAALHSRVRSLDALIEPSANVQQLFDRLRNEVVARLPASVATPPRHTHNSGRTPAPRGGLDLRRARPGWTIVVSGASDGAPSAVVAANLAMAFARTGAPTVLVLAHPSEPAECLTAPDRGLGVRATPGLFDVLTAHVPLAQAVQRSARYPHLDIVTTGTALYAGSPLQSQDLRDILLALRGRAAYVVLDAPSTAVSADAQCLARLADAAISVVELRRTTYGDVQDAADQLRQVGTPLLGAVVLPPGITAAVGPSSARHESHHEQNPPHSSTAQDTDATRLLPVVRADAEPRRRRPGKGMS